MTLYTSDYLDYYLTLVAWVVHNGVWAILLASGVFAIPFIVIIVQEWLRARTEGADEGNKGVLSSLRIENRVFVAIAVIVFAGIPFIDVDLNTIQFDTSRSSQCQVNAPQPDETGWSQSFTTLNNQSAQVPVWWFFMHSISRAVTGAAVAAIPRGTDLRQMRMEVDSTRVDNPLLSQEVADFSADCYGPARAKLFASRPELDDEQMNDVTWTGSRFFLDTPGYYDTYRSKTPRDSWAYDETRDAGLAEVESGAGYPTCEQWWSDEYYGLRTRLLQQVDPDLLSRMGNWAGFISREDMDDSVIRAIASPQQQNVNRGAVYTDYGGQVEMTLPNIFTVLQDHGILQGTPEGKAIWRATVTSDSGWSHSFTLLRLTPALIWESAERPPAFAGSVTVIASEEGAAGDGAAQQTASPDIDADSLPAPGPATTESSNPPVPSQAGEAIDELLGLIGLPDTDVVETTEPEASPSSEADTSVSHGWAPEGSPVPDAPQLAETQTPSGEHFIAWLRNGIESRRIVINDAKARVHTVADTVLLVSPGLFHCYTLEHPQAGVLARREKLTELEWVQKRFEKLQCIANSPTA